MSMHSILSILSRKCIIQRWVWVHGFVHALPKRSARPWRRHRRLQRSALAASTQRAARRLEAAWRHRSAAGAEREAETVVRYACLIRCAGDVHGEWVRTTEGRHRAMRGGEERSGID